jgi:hypothetical protein
MYLISTEPCGETMMTRQVVNLHQKMMVNLRNRGHSIGRVTSHTGDSEWATKTTTLRARYQSEMVDSLSQSRTPATLDI